MRKTAKLLLSAASPAGRKPVPLLPLPVLSTAAARGVRTRGGAPVPTEGRAVERELELSFLGLESAEGKRHAYLTSR